MSDNFLNSVETDTGEYTNVVTADDLNNIAKDLGYADYSHFPEEPPESAVSALNQITKDLTSKGVLRIGNECKVSISDGIISVADGVCVFETGAKKRINPGEVITVEFIAGSTNYVYMIHNETDNQIQLISSIEEPTTGSFVMLAEIDDKQNVQDRRYWSVSKVSNGVNKYLEVNDTFIFKPGYYDKEAQEAYRQPTITEYDVEQIGAEYVVAENTRNNEDKLVAFKISEGTTTTLYFSYYNNMEIKKEGSKIIVETYYNGHNQSNSISTKTQKIKLLFM